TLPGTLPAAIAGGPSALTYVDCLNEAGIEVFQAPGSPLPFPVLRSLSIQQLFDATYNRGATDARGNPLPLNPLLTDRLTTNLYMMLINALDGDPRAAGVMFDRQRRGAAVFCGILNQFFAANSDELMANYVFTVVHELGHCLNLPHAFESHAN